MSKGMAPAAALRALLDDAQAALRGGDAAGAERQAKAVSAIVRAEREVAELLAAPCPPSLEEDEEVLRAELRRRLAVYVAADRTGAPDDVLQRIAATGDAQ